MREPTPDAAATRDTLKAGYPIRLQPLSPEDGGGYAASIPQLGDRTFVAVGETPAEALQALDELAQYLVPTLMAEGVELPEPHFERESLEQFSGRVLLRLPRGLHARLVREARANGCSLNKLATEMLASGLERRAVREELRLMHATGSPESDETPAGSGWGGPRESVVRDPVAARQR